MKNLIFAAVGLLSFSLASTSAAQELYARGAALDILDVSDLNAITVKQSLLPPAIPGEGIDLDGAGNLYVGIQGLAIFDSNFNLIGQVIMNDPISNRSLAVAVRPSLRQFVKPRSFVQPARAIKKPASWAGFF